MVYTDINAGQGAIGFISDNTVWVMDAALFVLRILVAVALYAFLGVLLWVLLRERMSAVGPGISAQAQLIQLIADADVEGERAGRVYVVRSGAWIGRDPNCLVHTDDDFASARHAQVLWQAEDGPDGANGAWWLEDNLSRNGTFVNDTRITRAKLSPGDVIRVGRQRLRFGVEE